MVGAVTFFGCGEEPDPPGNRYVRVALRAGEVGGVRTRAARVEILTGGEGSASNPALCVNTDGEAGEVAASVVLSRSSGADLSAAVPVRVVAFDQLAGYDLVPVGKEFACPGQLPAPLTPPRIVRVSFCAAEEPREVVFHLASNCTCGEGLTCGAGLSTSGQRCAPEECCSAEVSSACALEIAR